MEPSTWLVPTIMGVQAIALALISRLRWRCLPDDNGKCICLSGCSEVPLIDSHEAVEAQEYVIGSGQKVLLVSSKIS